MDSGVAAQKLLYTQDEEYVITAAEYCTEYFAKLKGKRKREFIPVLDNILHPSSEDLMKKRLEGINKYYCFAFFQQPHNVWIKSVSCHCGHCLKGRWSECMNIPNTGGWTKRKLILNIYYDPNRPKKRHKPNNK